MMLTNGYRRQGVEFHRRLTRCRNASEAMEWMRMDHGCARMHGMLRSVLGLGEGIRGP